MPLDLTLLYRGTLSSCNYGCSYCPFAKHFESAAELEADRAEVARFVEWAGTRTEDRLAVFFTPWGEALVRTWYQQAVTALSRLPQVRKVAVQTNLSCRLDWLGDCDVSRLGLWCTYHPGEVSRRRFLNQCAELRRRGVPFSVGVVGLRGHFSEIEALRSELPNSTYLWVNAFKDEPDYYSASEIHWIESLDPLFRTNLADHSSLGQRCRTGSQVLSVNGQGRFRRCHFMDEWLGNLYEPGFESLLVERPCSKPTCGCHIGYVHLEQLEQDKVYGDGLLERVPVNFS